MSEIQERLLTPSVHLFGKRKPRRLIDLCLGVLGQNLDCIIEELLEIVAIFPSDIKMSLAAIARRRKLLNDDSLIALADSSWRMLDISGSAVTDSGLATVAAICSNLLAVDISKCDKISEVGVADLFLRCHSLETLRCGGCPTSESTARRCLSIFKPKLNSVEEDSWEELDGLDISSGAQSLHWLLWPNIDDNSLKVLETECPRVVVNPRPSLVGIRGTQVPIAALPHRALDDPSIEGIDPKTWSVASAPKRDSVLFSVSDTNGELSKAELFRLAFVERDTRLAPKRAKNARQRMRRFQREQLMKDADAKSLALAKHASKDLYRKG